MDRAYRLFASGVSAFPVAALFATTPACVADEDAAVDDAVARIAAERDEVRSERPDVTGAIDGRLWGDVGPARGLDVDADLLTAWDGGSFVSVVNVAALPERVVMLYASFSDPEALLVPGLAARFAIDERTLDQPSVVLLGCTGSEVNLYDEFDDVADVVDLVVEEAADGPPGALDVTLTGQFVDSVATSSFRLLR
jgi:hypothetical protein